MAVDYTDPDALFDWRAYGACLAVLAKQNPGLQLKIEPGRALTAYAACYVTEVLDVKRSYGRAFAVLLGGTHHLRTPAARGHDQPCTVIPVDGWTGGPVRPAVVGEPVTLVGQLCTPRDVLARDVPAAGPARRRRGRLRHGRRLRLEHLAHVVPHAPPTGLRAPSPRRPDGSALDCLPNSEQTRSPAAPPSGHSAPRVQGKAHLHIRSAA